MTRGYQHDYSATCDSMHSVSDRQRKAATMLAVLHEALGDRLPGADVLNLGCSTGIIDEHLAGQVATMTGVDIDEPAIALANSRKKAPNLRFQIEDAMNLSFPSASFDVVICSQVYEHVPDAVRMMEEIDRVLRTGGVCYFAATNRWAVMEKHHHLPFLSWLPPRVADKYVQLSGKGSGYYERHLGYRSLQELVSRFRVDDWTRRILDAPARYDASYMFRGEFSLRVARFMLRYFAVLFPGFIWLLWKTDAGQQ